METPDRVKSYCTRLQHRLVVGGLVSLAVLVGFYQRMVHASALRDMVYRKPPKLDPRSHSYCPFMLELEALETLHNPINSAQPAMFWREDLTRAIIQASFIGFFVLSIPAGVMADNFGGRWFLGIGVFILSICTLALPALTCPYCFLVGTMCQGAAEAIVLSSCIVLLAHWVPQSERAAFLGIVFSMKQFGVVFGHLQFRLFRQLELTWITMCYTSGIVGLICSLLLLVFIHDSPGRCPYINVQEKYYLWSQTNRVNYTREKTDPKQLVPLRQMFSSKPFLSMFLFQFGWSCIRVVLVYRLDRYLIHVLHLTRDLTYNCLALQLSALGISSAVGGVVGDYLVNSGIISRSTNRKLFGFLGNTLVLPLLLASVVVSCNGPLVCALYIVIFYINGFVDCSFGANVLDLAPRHAGVSFAILNCAHVCSELFNWELFIAICRDEDKRSEWLMFYVVCSVIVLSCSLPFLFFGSAEVQPYNSWEDRPVRDASISSHQEPGTEEGQVSANA